MTTPPDREVPHCHQTHPPTRQTARGGEESTCPRCQTCGSAYALTASLPPGCALHEPNASLSEPCSLVSEQQRQKHPDMSHFLAVRSDSDHSCNEVLQVDQMRVKSSHDCFLIVFVYSGSMTKPTQHDGMTFNEALGFTINQYLFAFQMTRTDLGDLIGLSRQVAGQKLRGRVGWTAEDLAIVAARFGVTADTLVPQPVLADGSWIPAAYVPGQQKAPAPAGAGAPFLVAGTGFEPATSGL